MNLRYTARMSPRNPLFLPASRREARRLARDGEVRITLRLHGPLKVYGNMKDLYVNTVAKSLKPGEQVLHRDSASHAPWWWMGIPTFQNQYLVLATSQRVLLVKHEKGFCTGDRMESVDTLLTQSRFSQMKALPS